MREQLLTKSYSSRQAFALGSMFCSIASATALGVNLVSAIFLVFALAIIVQFGRLVGARSGELDLGLGLGFVVGVGFFVFGGQILLVLNVPPKIAHWCVILVMACAIATIRQGHMASSGVTNESSFHEFLTSLSIAMLAVSAKQGWLLAFSIPLIAIEFLMWSKCKKNIAILVPLVLLPGWVLSQQLQPEHWWYFYQGNDSQFFESISWSTTQWGVSEHPGFVGGSTFAYHWFGYAFLGALSHIASLEPWEASMKIGVPLTLFFFINLLIAGIFQGQRRINYWVWIFGLIVASASFNSRFDSFGFSILIAIGFIQLVDRIPIEPLLP